MPSTNPVYQPTTVTYERHKEWSTSYLTDTVITNCCQKPLLQRFLLIGAIFLAIVGLGLTIYALVNDASTHYEEPTELLDVSSKSSVVPAGNDDNYEYTEDTAEKENQDSATGHDHDTNVVLGSVGICLILISLCMYVGFLHLRGTCKGLLPRLGQRASGQNQNGLADHGESGNDPVVTYKGVQESSSLNLEPSAPTEEERHSLMDNKYQSEDTERMMDDDPRIVLKPLRTAEEA